MTLIDQAVNEMLVDNVYCFKMTLGMVGIGCDQWFYEIKYGSYNSCRLADANKLCEINCVLETYLCEVTTISKLKAELRKTCRIPGCFAITVY